MRSGTSASTGQGMDNTHRIPPTNILCTVCCGYEQYRIHARMFNKIHKLTMAPINMFQWEMTIVDVYIVYLLLFFLEIYPTHLQSCFGENDIVFFVLGFGDVAHKNVKVNR